MSFKDFSTTQGDDKETKVATPNSEVQGPNLPSEKSVKKSDAVPAATKS
jgi:hypothetical protein